MHHALMMLRAGQADAVVAGVEMYYPDAIRPALEVIGTEPGRRHVSGIYMLVFPQQTYFFADCTVNIDPDAETLAEIASATASFVWRLGIRSEEHTSELQSPCNLVCRLLLEKKKKTQNRD